MSRKIGCTLVMLWVLLVSIACGEPPVETKVSFGQPFRAPDWEGIRETPPDWAGRRSLADSFEAGLKVAILSKRGVCEAETGHRFRCVDPWGSGSEFESTLLNGAEKCLDGEAEIAVVGVDPSKISLIKPSNDRSPVPKDVESEALRLVKQQVEHVWPISNSPPRVIRVDAVTLVQFGCVTQSLADQPVAFGGALVVQGNVFPLDILCARECMFFAVNNKLHLSCLSFWGCVTVYDLSNRMPEKVYENCHLSY